MWENSFKQTQRMKRQQQDWPCFLETLLQQLQKWSGLYHTHTHTDTAEVTRDHCLCVSAMSVILASEVQNPLPSFSISLTSSPPSLPLHSPKAGVARVGLCVCLSNLGGHKERISPTRPLPQTATLPTLAWVSVARTVPVPLFFSFKLLRVKRGQVERYLD